MKCKNPDFNFVEEMFHRTMRAFRSTINERGGPNIPASEEEIIDDNAVECKRKKKISK